MLRERHHHHPASVKHRDPPSHSEAMQVSSTAPHHRNCAFQLEEALFSTAPVGLHCVNAQGTILWANQMELNLLGFTREQYIGQQVESFVYMELEKVDSSSYLYAAAAAAAAASSGQRETNASADSRGASNQPINLLSAHDKTLYKEVLKRITSGHAIHNVPIRFITSSGSVVHLILDCDGNAILQPNATSVEDRYYRCFTRDDTARRIQEMRSNVLFQETNRSLQMLDNFMNRSMTQMRLPLALMERACNLVAENIEDIYEVISRNASAMMIRDTNLCPPMPSTATTVTAGSSNAHASSNEGDERKRRANAMIPVTSNNRTNSHAQVRFENANMDFAAPLSVALSATSEARSVVGLASRIVDDALALVDDITDLCRFDQGQGIVVDKEAVKLRDICIEALARVPIPLGSGVVEVLLDIQAGTPSRAMADRSVLQRCLALLMNFAVDAAANAVSKASSHGQVTGKVILSISDAALYQAQGSTSSCKISVFYTNPPDGNNVAAGTSDDAEIHNDDIFSVGKQHDGSIRGHGDNLFATSSFGERGGSMTRRTRLRESIERGMTTYQREKLGLGLSLVHHLVSAQGSDLRYEIVADETMTKFWFLLPMSLDFPERLNAEIVMKDDMQGQGPQLSAGRPLKRPKVSESMTVPPYPSNSLNLTLTSEARFSQQSHGSELSAPSPFAPAITVQNTVSNTEGVADRKEKPNKYPGVAPGARPLVLVVEDTDVSASLLCMHLRKLNCTSHRAENGEVALEMLRSAPDPSMYSLVLMDLRMPVMDGFEAAEIIKGSIASNIPIVALTGETSEEHKKKCDEIGFDDYQTKPLKRPQLKELLNKFVPGYQCPP
ncbi:hypothetical protein HJC23_006015 [Cyclotella cryptica]|uniref:LOV domain-containing protein n=1 Tax=Cyclotella cryptica TaxID=29204 RepID=A0ABD3P306_9STRA|eukprot:CCRYP_017884-RA/>CCRYP_017884-RA protein AED:0.02 eAED:0.02 QI:341/1/1/1/1/1/2/160/841